MATSAPALAYHFARAFFRVRILRGKAPLFVSWNISFRCNLNCQYCGSKNVRLPEMDVPAILEGLDALWRQGVRWVTFGGGEPFLKPGIEDVLAHAKKRGFQVYVSTNGTLIPEKAAALAHVDHVNLSCDGPRAVHDAVRGEGAFDKAMAAVPVLRDNACGVSLLCVLSRHNLETAEELLLMARALGVEVSFQPGTEWLNSTREPNPLRSPEQAYRATVARLIDFKRKGLPVRNSVSGLRYLMNWPNPAPLWCSAGRLSAVVEADGSLFSCHQAQFARNADNARGKAESFEKAFERLHPYEGCSACWCAALVELAMIFSLKPDAIINAMRHYR